MEKTQLDNKIEVQNPMLSHLEIARNQHKEKMKQALELVESIPDIKKRQAEYKKLSKISFRYYLKPKEQVELENKMKSIKQALKDSE